MSTTRVDRELVVDRNYFVQQSSRQVTGFLPFGLLVKRAVDVQRGVNSAPRAIVEVPRHP